jgi:hypothetical protein
MCTFDAFSHMDTCNLHDVNCVMVVLFPKTSEAHAVKDYHPISLIHFFGKLFSKVLACRLALRHRELVH